MYNSNAKRGFRLLALGAFLLGAAACQQSQENKEVQVELQLSLTGSGGGGTGTGGSSRDTTLTTTGKVTDGVLRLQVAIPAPPPPKGSYLLDISREFNPNTTRLVRYAKMSSDTGGSDPDTLFYKAPRKGKDDDDRK
ncbi:hypothetical protein [Paraflavitalea pollutisoli]|uniref:hypothetical protein n=1 Tax=Paraflavitalea pollutisoli TaxID=3034143 RepID=UPI0023EDCC53|nr:hypothetical protein [Paraflavitalea sp. H1-2-19X]